MKKTSALKSVGGDVGKLVVHTQPNFQGEQHEFKDSVAKINEGPWKGKPIKSLVVRGNPWLLYPEESAKVTYPTICYTLAEIVSSANREKVPTCLKSGYPTSKFTISIFSFGHIFQF